MAGFLGESILYHWTVLKDCMSLKGAHQNRTLYISFHFTRKENIFTKRDTERIADRGGTVVKVLCYKSVGRWFDSRWSHWNFS
jgi:hypothetical protein